MIKRFQLIRNLGRFENYSASGGYSFGDINLVYAENGLGKTTLSSVLRSLATGQASYIQERKRLGADHEPHVIVSLESGNAIFQNNSWSNTAAIEVFDTNFVNENVFSGQSVDHDHKRNLYRFVLGVEGVHLAKAIDDLVEEIKGINQRLKDQQLAIRNEIRSNLSVDDFVVAGPIGNIDQLIAQKQAEVESLRQADKIRGATNLSQLVLPQIPTDRLVAILQKTLEDVSAEAEEMVKHHLSHNTVGADEVWLENGLSYAKDNDCPFCGQSLEEIDLFAAYRDYFNLAYRQLKAELSTFQSEQSGVFATEQLLSIQRTIDNNTTLINFWQTYVDTDNWPAIDFEAIQTSLQLLGQVSIAHLERKILSPLETVSLDTSFETAKAEYLATVALVNNYNQIVANLNALIEDKKAQTLSGKFQQAEQELLQFLDKKRRHEAEDVRNLCDEYQRLKTDKTTKEAEKITAKNRLAAYTETLFATYKDTINRYLLRFGAGFQITDIKTGYRGGTPSSSFALQVNGNTVDLGKNSADGTPTFKTTLSDGDKSTLAFAFFLARLDQDSDLGQKVVVFDDPITSLDIHRKTATQQEISRVAERASQIIILSHDLHFLHALWKNANRTQTKTIRINSSGSHSSNIDEWDINREARGEYFESYYQLTGFLEQGAASDLRAVARCIRPVLEGYLRVRFPQEFPGNEWLGEFLRKIGQLSYPNLTNLNLVKTELEDINQYSSKYHHAQNTRYDSEPISHAELLSFVERTIMVIRG